MTGFVVQGHIYKFRFNDAAELAYDVMNNEYVCSKSNSFNY